MRNLNKNAKWPPRLLCVCVYCESSLSARHKSSAFGVQGADGLLVLLLADPKVWAFTPFELCLLLVSLFLICAGGIELAGGGFGCFAV